MKNNNVIFFSNMRNIESGHLLDGPSITHVDDHFAQKKTALKLAEK